MHEDLLAANEQYAAAFAHAGVDGRPAKRLAVLTCMDSRLDPMQMLGLVPGDAVVLRNAGARITTDVIESLELAQRNLGIERVLVVAHRDCRAAAAWELEADPAERARADAVRIREATSLDADAAVYDEATGRLSPAA